MLNKPKDWENVKAAQERVKLPAGGYVVKIMGAKVVSYPSKDGGNVDKLEISIDIADGEYKDFYANDFRSQTQEDKKWRGNIRPYLPKDDGSEKDGWTKSSFKALTTAIEESNPGFRWDWDEAKLKGKTVACLFQEQQWEMNGRDGWKAQPIKFLSLEQFRSGKFEVPAKKSLKNPPANNSGMPSAFETVDEDEGDLPF